MLHFHFGQGIQVEEDVRPLKGVTLGFQTVLEGLTEDQGQKEQNTCPRMVRSYL